MDFLVGGATLALAAGTFWLAVETRKMSAATQRMVELDAQPQLALAEFEAAVDNRVEQPEVHLVQLRLRLSNPGKVLVRFRVDSVSVSINGVLPPPAARYINRTGVVHPGTETMFHLTGVLVPKESANPAVANVSYDIAYWAISGKEQRLKASTEHSLGLPPMSGHAWLYLSGPEYS